jgi:hypothetical protein
MKCGIVKASTLARYHTWSPDFYLEPIKEIDKTIAYHEQAIIESQTLLEQRKKEREEIINLHKDIEVIEISKK